MRSRQLRCGAAAEQGIAAVVEQGGAGCRRRGEKKLGRERKFEFLVDLRAIVICMNLRIVKGVEAE